MHWLIAHLTNEQVFLISWFATLNTNLAVSAFPVKPFDQIWLQRRAVALTMHNLLTSDAFERVISAGYVSNSLVANTTLVLSLLRCFCFNFGVNLNADACLSVKWNQVLITWSSLDQRGWACVLPNDALDKSRYFFVLVTCTWVYQSTDVELVTFRAKSGFDSFLILHEMFRKC